jgi:hypothetical protein
MIGAGLKPAPTDAVFESMEDPVKANHALQRICTVIFLIPAGLVLGCGLEDTAPAPLCSYLPEPAITRVDHAPLTLEAALRKCEVEHRAAQNFFAQGYEIVATTENYSGQVMDWISAESVPGSDKPPPPPINMDDVHLPPGVQLGKTEFERYPELQSPVVDTVGIPRQTFSEYVNGETGASSLEEYLLQKSATQRQPTGRDRLYTGYGLRAHAKGTVANVNAFSGSPIESDTMSLMEMAVMCDGADRDHTQELIGIAASRDMANFAYEPFDGAQLRLQVEFYTQGPKVTGTDPDTGEGRGGWNGAGLGNANPGFVWKKDSVAHTGDILQASVVGGPQYEHRFEIQLFQGDWWLALNGEWFGWYPASKFDLMRDYACEVRWYTEVFDKDPGDWTPTDGGSGEFADAQATGGAAYFRRIFYTDPFGVAAWLLPNAAEPVGPQDPACYTTGPLAVTEWVGYENWFYCGGPGKDPVKAPFCQ